MSDGFALPNGVTIRMPRAGALDAQLAHERQEIDHWVAAVRTRGLRLTSVPEEYRQRVHARLCEVLADTIPIGQDG